MVAWAVARGVLVPFVIDRFVNYAVTSRETMKASFAESQASSSQVL